MPLVVVADVIGLRACRFGLGPLVFLGAVGEGAKGRFWENGPFFVDAGVEFAVIRICGILERVSAGSIVFLGVRNAPCALVADVFRAARFF